MIFGRPQRSYNSLYFRSFLPAKPKPILPRMTAESKGTGTIVALS